jgi:hypothetical protein
MTQSMVLYFSVPSISTIQILKVKKEGEIYVLRSNPDGIDEIFNNQHVRDRKIVLVSVVGVFRMGKSFLLDYCLRFLYATVCFLVHILY